MPLEQERDPDVVPEESAVPFTSRLIAYHRAQETESPDPLILDPFAQRLAGDMSSYFEKHSMRSRDYSIVRSYYVETQLLSKWCERHRESQVVLLGAGLDTRAYRISPLSTGNHTVFEVDFPEVILYKEAILSDETPLCRLVRLSTDLADPKWTQQMRQHSFNSQVPTFWILEGLIYYLEKKTASSILTRMSEISAESSEVFADICVPILAEVRFGAFMMHFKWGLELGDIPAFFSKAQWDVTASYADDHDQGRDVGQRGLIFIHGEKSSIA